MAVFGYNVLAISRVRGVLDHTGWVVATHNIIS